MLNSPACVTSLVELTRGTSDELWRNAICSGKCGAAAPRSSAGSARVAGAGLLGPAMLRCRQASGGGAYGLPLNVLLSTAGRQTHVRHLRGQLLMGGKQELNYLGNIDCNLQLPTAADSAQNTLLHTACVAARVQGASCQLHNQYINYGTACGWMRNILGNTHQAS